MNTITDAIARSISHTEIVYVDLSDLALALRAAAYSAGDTEMGDMCAVVMDVLRGNGTIEEYDDECTTYAEAQGDVMRCLLDCGGMHAVDCDDVKHNDVWEMWGTTEDGDYRVHIRLTA